MSGFLLKTILKRNFNRIYLVKPCAINENRYLSNQNSVFDEILNKAEKLIGNPISLLNIEELEKSNHPLIKIAKSFQKENNGYHNWDTVILLISRAAGYYSKFSDLNQEKDKFSGILFSQRVLAESVELMRYGYAIHKNIINLKEKNDNLFSGNKLYLLGGDYFLSTCLCKVATLKNQELIELISAGLRDQCESESLQPRDMDSQPLPAKPKLDFQEECVNIGDPTNNPIVVPNALGYAKSEWTLRTVLNTGSLLGKGCLGVLKLANQPKSIQEKGYYFGKHLALAWQAALDQKQFQPPKNIDFSLTSAPVLFQLEYEPSLYQEIEKGMEKISNVNYNLIYDAVLSGPGLEKTKQLQAEHTEMVLDALNFFPDNSARSALKDIVDVI